MFNRRLRILTGDDFTSVIKELTDARKSAWEQHIEVASLRHEVEMLEDKVTKLQEKINRLGKAAKRSGVTTRGEKEES